MKKFRRLSRRYVARQQNHAKKNAKKHVNRLRNHPFVVPVITFLGLFIISTILFVAVGGQTIGASDSRVVEISIDGKNQTLPTRASSVKDLLSRLKVEVADKDSVEPKLDTPILEDNIKITVNHARPVTIIDQGKKVTVLSAQQDPSLVVKDAGLKLSPEDAVSINSLPDPTKDQVIGMQISIDRAVGVQMNLYGNIVLANTRAKTIEGLLKEKGIVLSSDGQVFPTPKTPITAGLTIVIAQAGRKVQVVQEDIAFNTQTILDDTLPSGETKVVQQGSVGKKVVAYAISDVAGQDKIKLQEFVALKPVDGITAKGNKVIILGTKGEWLAAAGIPASDYAAVDYIIGRESGWCPTKWQGQYGGCPAYHGAPTSGGVGYGLCQATPGYKMASAGDDWAYNAVTQLKWCTNYAKKYGGWQGAYQWWIVNHWW